MVWNAVDGAQVRREPICVVGAGPAGLITAQVLLQDGFENVHILCKDSSVGGVWAKGRIYPTMRINNVHGEFRFSALPMSRPIDASSTGGRLRGSDISNYMEEFHDKFFVREGKSMVRFNTEVTRVQRGPGSQGWSLSVRDTRNPEKVETLHFPRIVLCTGGCSVPKFAKGLSPEDACAAGFTGPVVHSAEAWPRQAELLSAARQSGESTGGPNGSGNPIVVIGGGKSAQDCSALLAAQGVPVSVIFNKLELFLASPSPIPKAIRQGRLLSVLSPYMNLRTKMQRFLHMTWLGGKIVKIAFNQITEETYSTYKIPKKSPLRHARSLLWDVRTGDEGGRSDESFAAKVMSGKITAIAPTHVAEFTSAGVLLEDGRRIDASAVVCATGYSNSWKGVLDDETCLDIGLTHRVDPKELEKYADCWNYPSLRNPPKPEYEVPATTFVAPGLYKGMVPASGIERRDIAVNGATFNGNSGYTYEVNAHWISAYFLGEKMNLPKTSEDATEAVIKNLAWVMKRYPACSVWDNPSYAAYIPYLSSPIAMDELMEDMHLPSLRSGGNWLTWLFKPISSDELVTMSDERRKKRGETFGGLS